MEDITRKMIKVIRDHKDKDGIEKSKYFISERKEEDNFLTRSKILMEEAAEKSKKKEEDGKYDEKFYIKKDTKQFGDIRTSQEETLKKTVGERVELDANSLVFYPKASDMTLTGKIPHLNISFQFRYEDPSGDGVYVWANALQLTESNERTLGKIRDAFMNWKDSSTEDGDLMENLKKAAEEQKKKNA